MGLKVHKSELNSSAIQSLLDSEVQDTENLITALNSFINGSVTTLTGQAYDAARAEASAYVSILQKRKQAAQELKSAVASSTSSLSGYMGSYDYLDDADIPVLESEIASIEASYESIKQSYYARYNKNFITRIVLNWKISSANRKCAQQIAPLQEEIKVIKGLASADSTAYGLLTKGTTTTDSYRSAITGK